jgi:AcrR family transcriptional regulator
MGEREQAIGLTRTRIVDAAKKLHAERGLLATGWDDIAREAGVSSVTVYRHFRSLHELIPACALSYIDEIGPMTIEEATAAFADLRGPRAKLQRLVISNCDCYERGEGWMNAATREAELIPELGAVVAAQQLTLERLVRVALEEPDPAEPVVATLRSIIDFPFWKALRNAGQSAPEAKTTILGLVEAVLLHSSDEFHTRMPFGTR